MKEIASMSANFLARIPAEPGEKFVVEVEVALAISEIVYHLGTTGELQKERAVETVRFVATADHLRTMAKNLTRYADEAATDLAEALREHGMQAIAENERRRPIPPPKPTNPTEGVI